MRFVIDQQLPPALANWLIDRNHEAQHVRELGLADADDGAIQRWAINSEAIIVTKDADFVMISPGGPQVLWIRFGNVTNDVLFARLGAAWTAVEVQLTAGDSIVEVR